MALVVVAFALGLYVGIVQEPDCDDSRTVELFTADMTIQVQCSGNCDLTAMIAEAREAVEK